MNVAKTSQAIYLLQGELRLRYFNEEKHTISGGTETGKYSLTSNPKIKDTFALTDVVILRVDADLLDIMLTWDQMSETDEMVKMPQALEKASCSNCREASLSRAHHGRLDERHRHI